MAERVNHELLIDRLSDSLRPVRRPLPAWLRALGWMALALPCGLAATRAIPRYQPDWGAPGMAWAVVEIVLSLGLGVAVVVSAFDISIAGRPLRAGRVMVGLGLVWLAVCVGNIAVSPWHAVRLGAGLYCYTFMMLAGVGPAGFLPPGAPASGRFPDASGRRRQHRPAHHRAGAAIYRGLTCLHPG